MGVLRWDNGFTLIEMLTVMIVISTLATIALGKFKGTKDQAYEATMLGDIHTLTIAQESYMVDNNTYYGGIVPDPSFPFHAAAGVTATLTSGSPAGWSALLTHQNSTTTCGVFVGGVPAQAPATSEGVAACQRSGGGQTQTGP